MSRLNITSDLFLGLQELNRQNKFTKEDGYIRIFRSLINNFGIVNVDTDPSFVNFKVEAGSNAGTIKIAVDSYAVDDNINIITQRAIDNIDITDDSNWYWVRITYQEDGIEEGTVDLAANGDVTGTITKFSEVLRDQNNYPVKINFPNSILNTDDYQVASVLSDTSAILSGSTGFVSENGVSYRVVGSYTPGINPVGDDRLPYFYDSCDLELVLETVPNTPPVKTEGEQFYLARVQNIASSLTIQDKRTEILNVAKLNTGWVTPSLGVEFTNIGGKEVQYRKNYIGEVEIRGTFTTTVGTATLFTLPEEFRPLNNSQGIYGFDDGSVIKLITVSTAGVVVASTTFPFSTGDNNEIITLKFKTA